MGNAVSEKGIFRVSFRYLKYPIYGAYLGMCLTHSLGSTRWEDTNAMSFVVDVTREVVSVTKGV